ncbi:hypothetical protein QIH97_gp07 [Enterobacter phage KNP3]|nr:hypothetical protein QIH97_gp07 [Enterobacter phage KNP3]
MHKDCLRCCSWFELNFSHFSLLLS